MKKRWNFQLCPNVPNIISKGYLMDDIGEATWHEINDALPAYLRFHGVNKIVAMLGPNVENEKDYTEKLGVGFKQCNQFDLIQYCGATNAEKQQMLRECIIELFSWIEATFADSGFVGKARSKVSWLTK